MASRELSEIRPERSVLNVILQADDRYEDDDGQRNSAYAQCRSNMGDAVLRDEYHRRTIAGTKGNAYQPKNVQPVSALNPKNAKAKYQRAVAPTKRGADQFRGFRRTSRK